MTLYIDDNLEQHPDGTRDVPALRDRCGRRRPARSGRARVRESRARTAGPSVRATTANLFTDRADRAAGRRSARSA